MSPLEKLFTVEDIAQMTSLTTRTIRNYLKDGSLVGCKIGGQWRFTEEDIKNFMSRDAVITHFKDVATQSIYDFIDGVNTDVKGKLQICNIIDLYTSYEKAVAKNNQICDIVNKEIKGMDIQYDVTIDGKEEDEEVKIRFVLYGPPSFLMKVYPLLED